MFASVETFRNMEATKHFHISVFVTVVLLHLGQGK